jgi:hypothetical protein
MALESPHVISPLHNFFRSSFRTKARSRAGGRSRLHPPEIRASPISFPSQQALSAGDSSFPRDLEQGVAPLRGRISFLRRRSRRRRPPLVSFLRSSSGCSGVVSQSICLPVLSIVMRLFLCVPAWLSFSLDETANSFLRFSFLVLGGGLWILEILRI